MMGSLLNGLIFTQPLLLFALAGLPVLWFLLRVMPPRPRVIVLPSLRFLEGLLPEKTSPSHTPWWILLLRLLILALVILALSGPVMNPSAGLESDKPLRLVIDNGWSAAPVWDAQLREADNLIAQAERANIPVLLLTTAAVSAPEAQDPPRLMAAAEARSTIKGIAPRPWDTDYLSLIPRIEAMSDQEFQSVWLSDGIAHRGFDGLAKALAAKRSVSLFHPAPEALALALNIRHSLSGVEVICKMRMSPAAFLAPSRCRLWVKMAACWDSRHTTSVKIIKRRFSLKCRKPYAGM
ncbi:MAG: BatA domain-containing protein [Alphaproteobacteria bacterium]|nr:BatA domain-containing protein [Alphaproteobacteria bacterium]